MLTEHEKKAIANLLPLFERSASIGLHESRTLPRLFYETPAHLDYACQLLEADDPAFAATPLFRRLRVISRTVVFQSRSIDRIKRFRGAGGPHDKQQFFIRQTDPMVRWDSGSRWATTGDEAQIYQRFNRLIKKACDKTRGMLWWRGCNDDQHAGRFWPIPKTQGQLNTVIGAFRKQLESLGFQFKRGIPL